ncbi:MAG TPA: hypothetical protein VLS96_22325 [Nodosilinea sp.]|nr:hypothetical protein [Nodosilinea sp.]
MASSLQPKPCALCQRLAVVRYRICCQPGGPWQLVCPACQQQQSTDNPHYRYGGTWKARRQKR